MKQKELEEGIRNGINKSINDLCKQFLIVIAIVGTIYLVAYISHNDIVGELKWQKENCDRMILPTHCDGSRFPPIVADTPRDMCAYRKLYCSIIDAGIQDRMVAEQGDVGGGPTPILVDSDRLCGYQEALAWFELSKQSLQSKNVYMECGY